MHDKKSKISVRKLVCPSQKRNLWSYFLSKVFTSVKCWTTTWQWSYYSNNFGPWVPDWFKVNIFTIILVLNILQHEWIINHLYFKEANVNFKGIVFKWQIYCLIVAKVKIILLDLSKIIMYLHKTFVGIQTISKA